LPMDAQSLSYFEGIAIMLFWDPLRAVPLSILESTNIELAESNAIDLIIWRQHRTIELSWWHYQVERAGLMLVWGVLDAGLSPVWGRSELIQSFPWMHNHRATLRALPLSSRPLPSM
jgi:hypothetical protein